MNIFSKLFHKRICWTCKYCSNPGDEFAKCLLAPFKFNQSDNVTGGRISMDSYYYCSTERGMGICGMTGGMRWQPRENRS